MRKLTKNQIKKGRQILKKMPAVGPFVKPFIFNEVEKRILSGGYSEDQLKQDLEDAAEEDGMG